MKQEAVNKILDQIKSDILESSSIHQDLITLITSCLGLETNLPKALKPKLNIKDSKDFERKAKNSNCPVVNTAATLIKSGNCDQTKLMKVQGGLESPEFENHIEYSLPENYTL